MSTSSPETWGQHPNNPIKLLLTKEAIFLKKGLLHLFFSFLDYMSTVTTFILSGVF